MKRAFLISCLMAMGARGAQAQTPSPYVPLDDIAYRYLDALLVRGYLNALPTLERPYTVRAVRRAMAQSLGTGDDRLARGLYASLERELDKFERVTDTTATSTVSLHASGGVHLRGETSGRQELMLADSNATVSPAAFIRGYLRAGSTLLSARLKGDLAIRNDPQYLGNKKGFLLGRIEDGYVSWQGAHGDLFFGRQARNWGPFSLDGLVLGRAPYTYDHAYASIGGAHLRISLMLARLDDFRDSTSPPSGDTTVAQRYFAAHRLSVRWKSLEVTATEAALYGGVGRSFEPSFANPLNEYWLTEIGDEKQVNVFYSIAAAWRHPKAGLLSFEFMLDDFQIDQCDPICGYPPRYGVSFVAEGVPITRQHRLFASATRASSLAYRTHRAFEQYSVRNFGLGRNYSDYAEYRVGVDAAPTGAVMLKLYAALRRQGEGDFRIAYPTLAQIDTIPNILIGTVTSVRRLGVTGGGGAGRFTVQGDVGYNWVTNADHVAGRKRGLFGGRIFVSAQVLRDWLIHTS